MPEPERPVRGKPTLADTPQNELKVRAFLHELDGNVSGAAERLGITRSALREFMIRNLISSKRADRDR